MASSLFLVPYPPGRASSQRFRFEQYLDALTTAGHQYRLVPFLDVATWAMLYKPGQTRRKELGRRIVCYYGDAIWTKGPAGEQGIIGRRKWQQKVGSICRWCSNASSARATTLFSTLSLTSHLSIQACATPPGGCKPKSPIYCSSARA